ncbi:DMT family transporter [Candidatus Latescibacterota bacterium]
MNSPDKQKLFSFADIAMIITTVCWGLNFVITKSATGHEHDQFRIFVYNIIRFPSAALLLFITARLKGRKIMIYGRDMISVALLSFVGIFVYQILYMFGQTMTESANIGIIYSIAPILIVIISVISKIDKPTFFTFAGGLLGFCGLVLILFEGGSFSIDKGSLLFFLGLFCWAFYAVFSKPILDRYSPITVTAWVLFFGTVFQLPLAIYQIPNQMWAELSGQNILFVTLSTLLSLYTGYTLFYYSVSKIGPAKAGIYTNLTPVFTIFFAVTIRGETIRMIQIIGFAIIVSGIFVTKINYQFSGSKFGSK